MKRFLTLLAAAGLTSAAYSQSAIEIADQFYNSQEWERAFAGYYGVNPGVEPGIPEADAEREALGVIRPLLQQGSDAALAQAATVLDGLIETQQTAGESTSPMILQIAGTITMRLADTTTNKAEITRYQNRSEAYLKQAIASDGGFPNFLRAHKNLANLFFKMDRRDEALKHFIKALELGDKDAVTYGLLGAIYLDQGKMISAESSLRTSLMINPEILEFKQLLGNVLLAQERYNEAKEIFTELLARRPNEINYWNAQSNCYIALDMIDDATKNLEIVRIMGRANVQSLLLLGDVYMNKEMILEATDVYLEAIELETSVSMAERFIDSAETLNNFAAYEESMKLVDAVTNKFPDAGDDVAVDLLTLRSEINISLGKGEEAAENLENLLRRDPMNARALLTLADYYAYLDPDEDLEVTEYDLQKSRNEQKAMIYFERAQNLDDLTTRVRAFIGEAQLQVSRKDYEEAADLLEEAQGLKYQDTVQSYLEQIRAALRARRS